jgi:hypothetical protein
LTIADTDTDTIGSVAYLGLKGHTIAALPVAVVMTVLMRITSSSGVVPAVLRSMVMMMTSVVL